MSCKDLEEGRAYARGYYWKHREDRMKYKKENKEHNNKMQREWYYNNLDRIRKHQGSFKFKIDRNLQRRERKKTDINYKILSNLRGRLHNTVARGLKSTRTLELLGCSVDFLRRYLENKFEEGMSWGDYGLYGWHVDHIIPCSNFDLTKPEEQRRCFHYSNLQPLWARDNLIKGNHLGNKIKDKQI